MKYILKCTLSDKGTVKFITEKSGKRNSNSYFAMDLVYGDTTKVDYKWIKKNIDDIANAEVCGSKLYHKNPIITFDKDIYNHIHNTKEIAELVNDNIIKSNSLLSILLERDKKHLGSLGV